MIKTDDTLWMWGRNDYGQLGDGTNETRHSPVKIADDGLCSATGDWHSATVKTDGTLWTWGASDSGELGSGENSGDRFAPAKVMNEVHSVSLGHFNSAVIKKDGTLWIWGDNPSGIMGDGTTTGSYNPKRIMGGVTSFALGYNHSVAVKADGSLWTWGFNNNGQLGDGTTKSRLRPVKIMDGLEPGTVLFSDTNSATPHSDDILWLAETQISEGWMRSDASREFRPYAIVARADMAAFLFRLAKLKGLVDDSWTPKNGTESRFSDVNSKTPHSMEIWWLAEMEVSEGWKTPKGDFFRPYETVKRCDMAAFLSRLNGVYISSLDAQSLEAAGMNSLFRDVDMSTPHCLDILWLAEVGVSEGWTVSSGKEFRPYETVKRCDMAAFLHRLHQYWEEIDAER